MIQRAFGKVLFNLSHFSQIQYEFTSIVSYSKSDPALLSTLELDVGGEWSSVRAGIESLIGTTPIHFLVNCAAVIFFEMLADTKESSLDRCDYQIAILISLNLFLVFIILLRIYNVNFKGLVNITQVCFK